jgi:hypothetical protein
VVSNLAFRIKSVDMNGFLGRENHPSPSDVGLRVVPLKMAAYYYDADGQEEPVIGDDGRLYQPAMQLLSDGNDDTEQSVLWFWTCATEDGRVLDLIDFELEVVNG